MKISIWEALVIIIALMWLFGFFRRIFSASNNQTQNNNPQQQQQQSPNVKPSSKSRYGENEGEYVDYEEVH